MRSYRSYLALANLDEQCAGYIAAYGNQPAAAPAAAGGAAMPLAESIERGLRERAIDAAKEMLQTVPPLEVVNNELIPALDRVGKGFEKGTVFLPQLLMSAEAAKAAFEVVKDAMRGHRRKIKGAKLFLRPSKGDIHDIGKNIVKVLLENYAYQVLDLGKDVPPEVIVDTAIKEDVPLVGLSALMTTTVVSMEQTIRLLREKKPGTKVVVGGAVLTQEYADSIGADCYANDAMATVHYADSIFLAYKEAAEIFRSPVFVPIEIKRRLRVLPALPAWCRQKKETRRFVVYFDVSVYIFDRVQFISVLLLLYIL